MKFSLILRRRQNRCARSWHFNGAVFLAAIFQIALCITAASLMIGCSTQNTESVDATHYQKQQNILADIQQVALLKQQQAAVLWPKVWNANMDAFLEGRTITPSKVSLLIPLQYSGAASRGKGKVWFACLVNKEGTVESIRYLPDRNSPAPPGYVVAIHKALSRWEFSPCLVEGKALEHIEVLPFDPQDAAYTQKYIDDSTRQNAEQILRNQQAGALWPKVWAANAADYRAGKVITAPKLVHVAEPPYQRPAFVTNHDGTTVWIAILVDQSGFVVASRILPNKDAQLPGSEIKIREEKILFKAAENAVSQWQFAPRLVDGRPSEFVTVVPVAFAAAPAQ